MDIIPFDNDHSLPADVTLELFSALDESQNPSDYIIEQYQDENFMWCYRLKLKADTEPTETTEPNTDENMY
jgi:hypothetical protein